MGGGTLCSRFPAPRPVDCPPGCGAPASRGSSAAVRSGRARGKRRARTTPSAGLHRSSVRSHPISRMVLAQGSPRRSRHGGSVLPPHRAVDLPRVARRCAPSTIATTAGVGSRGTRRRFRETHRRIGADPTRVGSSHVDGHCEACPLPGMGLTQEEAPAHSPLVPVTRYDLDDADPRGHALNYTA